MTADCINCIVKWCAKSGKYSFGDTCEDFAPITTNADRIRGMSDEELAEWLKNTTFSWTCLPRDNGNRCADFKDDCNACWLNWLEQEAE